MHLIQVPHLQTCLRNKLYFLMTDVYHEEKETFEREAGQFSCILKFRNGSMGCMSGFFSQTTEINFNYLQVAP